MKVLLSWVRKLILGYLVFSLLFCKNHIAYANQMNYLNDPNQIVIEHLRLKVPNKLVKAWLLAEKGSWENWLAGKNGFIGRQLLLDTKNEEATVLISWSSRDKWKNIPQDEIQLVQESFENIARKEIGLDEGNPFPLLFEGELLPQ